MFRSFIYKGMAALSWWQMIFLLISIRFRKDRRLVSRFHIMASTTITMQRGLLPRINRNRSSRYSSRGAKSSSIRLGSSMRKVCSNYDRLSKHSSSNSWWPVQVWLLGRTHRLLVEHLRSLHKIKVWLARLEELLRQIMILRWMIQQPCHEVRWRGGSSQLNKSSYQRLEELSRIILQQHQDPIGTAIRRPETWWWLMRFVTWSDTTARSRRSSDLSTNTKSMKPNLVINDGARKIKIPDFKKTLIR